MTNSQCRSVSEHILRYVAEKRRSGWRAAQIYKSLAMTRSNFYRKVKTPGSMTLDELRYIADKLTVSVSELLGESNDRKE